MNRAEKNAMIEGLTKTFNENPHIIVAGFRGLSANQANVLRRKIDEAGGSCRVVRNRLAKRAAVGTPAEVLIDKFEGPCAVLHNPRTALAEGEAADGGFPGYTGLFALLPSAARNASAHAACADTGIRGPLQGRRAAVSFLWNVGLR